MNQTVVQTQETRARKVTLRHGQQIEVPVEGNTALSAPDGDISIAFGAQGMMSVRHAGSSDPMDPQLLALIDSLPEDQDFEILGSAEQGYDVQPLNEPGLRIVRAAA